MFEVAPTELLLVAIVALLVIGPKDLPKALRVVGHWVGKARGMARHFRSGIDTMIRESELEEMQRKWAEENARIMREHPPEPLPVPAAIDHAADEDGPDGLAPDRHPDAIGAPPVDHAAPGLAGGQDAAAPADPPLAGEMRPLPPVGQGGGQAS